MVSIAESISFSASRLFVIFGWALIAATVGLILKILEQVSDRSGRGNRNLFGFVARIVVDLIGVAWSLGTFFVIPIMIFENVGPIEAMRRSVELIKKTWGESIGGGIGLSIVFFFFYVIGILLGFFALVFMPQSGFIAIGALVIYLSLVFLAHKSIKMIFVCAVYKYAREKKVALFEPDQLEHAFLRR